MEVHEHLLRKQDGQPLRYLLVDDSLFALQYLRQLVQAFGGVVAGQARDGRAAIEAYDTFLPDIVLMDVTMPDMEGIEAAERIIGFHPEARIVMVSSVGYQENVSESLRKGALYFVQKPPKPELLFDAIKCALGEEVSTAAGQ